MRGIPSPWGQAFPRSVRPAPDGFLVPAATLRVLLKKSGRLQIIFTGDTWRPWFGDGAVLRLDAHRAPRTGDLALCDASGWGDIRRLVRRTGDGGWLTALDPEPGAREIVPATGVLAVVEGRLGAGGPLGAIVSGGFPFWSRLAAGLHGTVKAIGSPAFGDEASASVGNKYGSQVESYSEMIGNPPGEELRRLLSRRFPAGGSILVAGCGAGSEVLHLARAGYRVTGFDVLEGMIRAARTHAAAAGIQAELLQADMADLDLAGRRFDGVYITPLVYSFVAGRARRVRCLQRLCLHLEAGAPVVFSADLVRTLAQRLQLWIAWGHHVRRAAGFEPGDWHTSYMLPDGTIGRSYTHLFSEREIVSEARRAGFAECRRAGAYFVARCR